MPRGRSPRSGVRGGGKRSRGSQRLCPANRATIASQRHRHRTRNLDRTALPARSWEGVRTKSLQWSISWLIYRYLGLKFISASSPGDPDGSVLVKEVFETRYDAETRVLGGVHRGKWFKAWAWLTVPVVIPPVVDDRDLLRMLKDLSVIRVIAGIMSFGWADRPVAC